MTLGAAGSTATSTLRGLTRYLTNTNSTKFSDADVDALLNLGYHHFVNEFMRAGGDIDFNMATEEINLVADQQAYTVTGKVLMLKRVEITYDGALPRDRVNPLDVGQQGRALDTTSIGNNFTKKDPFYDAYISNEAFKLDLYPIPDAAVTNGLVVWKVLEITELSGTSDEPSIPEAYQPYLSYYAAKERFIRQGLFQRAREMDVFMVNMMDRALNFQASRNEDEPTQVESVYNSEYGD